MDSTSDIPSHPRHILSSIRSSFALNERNHTLDMAHPRTPSPRTSLTKAPSFSDSALHDSPFSDYHTEPSFSPNQTIDTRKAQEHYRNEVASRRSRRRSFSPVPYQPTPVQLDLMWRLHDIGKLIARNVRSPAQAQWLDERFDAIEAYLCAPESQTRLPPELEDSGLFMDEDVSDDENVHGQDDNSNGGLGLGKEVMDVFLGEKLDSKQQSPSSEHASDTAAGAQGQEKLGTKCEEDTTLGDAEVQGDSITDVDASSQVKSIVAMHQEGALSQYSGRSVDAQISALSIQLTTMSKDYQRVTEDLKIRFEENRTLNRLAEERLSTAQKDYQSLRKGTDKLILDLHLDYSELLFLKLQLQTIETKALQLESKTGDSDFSFYHAIERLELDWRDVEKRFTDRLSYHNLSKIETKRDHAKPRDLQGELQKIQEKTDRARRQKYLELPKPIREQLSRASSPAPSHGESVTGTLREALSVSMEQASQLSDDTEIAGDESQDECEDEDSLHAQGESSKESLWDRLANAVGIIDYYDLFNSDS